jgi:hypothetical protein
MVQAIAADLSNWQRVPTPTDIARLKQMGVKRVIIGSSFGTVWQEQIAVCEAAGFEVQEYMFPGHIHPTNRVWWLDVEQAETADEVIAIVGDHQTTTPPTGIYTRKGIFILLDVNIVALFPGLKLWDANYGPLPRTFSPYGGWLFATMTQYQDTTDIGTGLAVDLSVYEEIDMTPEEVDAAIEAKLIAEVWPKIGALLTQLGNLGAGLVATGNALAQHIATHPGGGATITMVNDIADMQAKVGVIEAETAALEAKVKAIGAAANG